MKRRNNLFALIFLASLGWGTVEVHAQVGTCREAIGETYLDINNVRARILNNGNLFWRGDPHVYNVPKGGRAHAIFAAGIWIGGYEGDQLRIAAARYGNYHFWAGPLDENGEPPTDCGEFDRLYKVSIFDIQEYESTGVTTPDLQDWPTGLGAPTYAVPNNGIDDDRDGIIDEEEEKIFLLDQPLSQRIDRKIDLASGERPALLGDQSIWWVMNDRGNEHNGAASPPIGLEVHVTAFAFRTSGDLGNSTFYKYDIYYKGSVPFERVHMAVFVDPDIGNLDDDWIGADTSLGLGYGWNGDNDDEGLVGYGSPPPAIGYDFFQGPVVPSPGDRAKFDGEWISNFKNLKMTSFTYFNNDGGIMGDPETALGYYNYMRGRWVDGACFTEGGNGRTFSQDCTSFAFPGDPGESDRNCEYWSECNSDGKGANIAPADRRFVVGTGPFRMNPGDFQQIVYGVIWAQGANNHDSVQKLKSATTVIQAAYDIDFDVPSPPDAPKVTATPRDGGAILEWTNSPQSNNFLESYKITDPFAPINNNSVVFEGYEVRQYESALDQIGEIVAVYDIENGIQRLVDGEQVFVDGLIQEEQRVVANGTDQGVQNYYVAEGLTNYKTYYFGVQAYAQNYDNPGSKVYRGAVSRVNVVPAKPIRDVPDLALMAIDSTGTADFTAKIDSEGEGIVQADIINPVVIKEATYAVEFFRHGSSGKSDIPKTVSQEPDRFRALKRNTEMQNTSSLTYNIKRDETILFNGASIDYPAPLRKNVMILDGLLFTILNVDTGYNNFQVTANASGPLETPAYAAVNWEGFPNPGGLPLSEYQGGIQQSNGAVWFIHGGGSDIDYESFVKRTLRDGSLNDAFSVNDYEIRFTERCARTMDGNITLDDCIGLRALGDMELMEIPFELWDIGKGTPMDPSDDVRLVAGICEGTLCGAGIDDGVFDVGGDHTASSRSDDPVSDWIYFYRPSDTTPGQRGRDRFYSGDEDVTLEEVISRIVLVGWDIGSRPPYNPPLPETGTVFRITSTKTIQPGDVYSFSTEGYAPEDGDLTSRQSSLEDIGIVPNPYKGASDYEVSQLIDEVRFTNLPDEAIIRVFTLNGTLIKTINKQTPNVATISWNLTTDHNLPIASGLYLVNVEVPGVGSHTIKFAVVKKRVQLNVY